LAICLVCGGREAFGTLRQCWQQLLVVLAENLVQRGGARGRVLSILDRIRDLEERLLRRQRLDVVKRQPELLEGCDRVGVPSAGLAKLDVHLPDRGREPFRARAAVFEKRLILADRARRDPCLLA
jgi:hypothetical protein